MLVLHFFRRLHALRLQRRLLANSLLSTLLLCHLTISALAQTSIPQTSPDANRNDDNPVSNARIPTGQILSPVGRTLELPGRPNDLAFSADTGLLFVKNYKSLDIIDAATWQRTQSLPLPGGASLVGILVDQQNRVFVSNAAHQVHVFAPKSTDKETATPEALQYALTASLEMPAKSFPCGLALSADESRLYVCLSKANQIAIASLAALNTALERPAAIPTTETKVPAISLAQLELQTVDVGIAPYGIETIRTPRGEKVVVTNIGGRQATEQDMTATSAGTETPVDASGIANTSLVSVMDASTVNVELSVATGLHPSAVTALPHTSAPCVAVTNTNNDSISILNIGQGTVDTSICKPSRELPYGSMPNALTVSPDEKYAFVALSGNNAVAVFSLKPNSTDSADSESTIFDQPLGFIPTGWFPAGLVCSQDYLFVGNLKGLGSRASVRDKAAGRNSHDHLGMLQRIDLSAIENSDILGEWTSQVRQQAKTLPLARLDLSLGSKSQVAPKPIPAKLGQPSTFKHVIYVIKENRTYDQVFGDIRESRSDPKLCIFPEKNTPNHHALARRFGILDNYYCNGVLSADGHSWATEGNVTPYLERAFGGFARSYTFGDDPITYSSSGFLWDPILDAGLSFRNYGEMHYAEPPEGMDYQAIWNAYQADEAIEFKQEVGIERLARYSSPEYPGWNMIIPDVLRMDCFLKEFDTFQSEGSLPNLCIVYLPQDHLGGGVTSAAHMADNDLALGRLVEAVSNSPYWQDTLIIANEDDPQNGYDHIDGHRSICLVVSAYSRSGINHQFYNQTSVLRTILHIFGLAPMNQQQARSPLMTECFNGEPDLTPFKAMPANFPLNQRPTPQAKQSPLERQWRSKLATVPIQRTGMKTEADEDNLNRFVWHEMRGWSTPYPSERAGSHGQGLAALGLAIDPEASDD